MKKVINNKNKNIVKKIKKPTVFVPMAADILHHGHIRILLKAKKLGNVIVGLMTDEGIKKYKKKNPFMRYKIRKEILSHLKMIDFIIPLDGLRYVEIMDELKCNYFVHGSDWKNNAQSSERKKLLKKMKKWNGKVIEPLYTKGISSTSIKNYFNQSK